MIKEYLEDHLQPAFSAVGHFKTNLAGSGGAGITPTLPWVAGHAGVVLLSVEGSMSGQSNVSLQGENQNKKGCSLFFVTSSSQHRNPNLPQDLFSPSSYQENFTSSGMD